jgi:hypothetical protein
MRVYKSVFSPLWTQTLFAWSSSFYWACYQEEWLKMNWLSTGRQLTNRRGRAWSFNLRKTRWSIETQSVWSSSHQLLRRLWSSQRWNDNCRLWSRRKCWDNCKTRRVQRRCLYWARRICGRKFNGWLKFTLLKMIKCRESNTARWKTDGGSHRRKMPLNSNSNSWWSIGFKASCRRTLAVSSASLNGPGCGGSWRSAK